MHRPSAILSGAKCAVLATAVAAMCAGPAAAENVLRFVSFAGGAVTFDPHSLVHSYNRVATQQVYEALLDVDSNLEIVPQLALSWAPIDPVTWMFELRREVRFHDGTPLVADDVAFSIERALVKTSDWRESIATIASVEAIDDHTVHVTTSAPDALLWLKLSHVAIVSRSWAEQHGVTIPADAKGTREETYATRHANGTGPFRLESFEPGGRYVLVRNPDWWGADAVPQGNLDRIVHIWEGDADRHLAALLDGEIHLLQDPPFAAHELIRRTNGVSLKHTRRLFTPFLGMDQGSAELRTSDIEDANPFQDVRVRRAMYHAIDVEAALRDLMGDLLHPAGMLVGPGINGHSPKLDRRVAHDPERARALLAEAGYPDGFSVALDCPSDWGADDMTTCEAVAAQLAEVGIDVTVRFEPMTEHRATIFERRESDFFYWTALSVYPDSARVLARLYHSRGPDNVTGYANPEVDALIEKAEAELVTYARDAYLEEAWRIVTDDVVYLPVRHSVSVVAQRDELELPVDPWNIPRFRGARLKRSGN